jgi:glucose-1-phosphatase
MTPIRIVCFDWGGVIIRICRSWEQGCALAGVPNHPQLLVPDRRAQRVKLAEEYQRGELACEEFFSALADTTEGLLTPEQVRSVHDAWLIDEYPGVGSLVDSLNARAGVTTAMLSNTNESHWKRQHGGKGGFPAAARLDIRLASHELGIAKPDPAIYRVATERFGVSPGEVLFFDDLPDNIEAARNTGWQAHRIDYESDTCAQMREHLMKAGVLEVGASLDQ